MANGGTIAGAAISGVDGLFKLGTAIAQLVHGKKLQKELDAQGRPVMTTPEAFTEKEGMARSQYLDPRFAGQSAMEDQAKATAANQVGKIQDTAGSGAGALTAMLAGNGQLQNNLTNIGVQGAQFQQQDLAKLMGLLGEKSQLQQQQWDFNKWQPYAEKAAQARALTQAGQTNISNALSDGANLAIGMGQQKDAKDALATYGSKGMSRMAGIAAGAKFDPNSFMNNTQSGLGINMNNVDTSSDADYSLGIKLRKLMNPALHYKPQPIAFN